MAKLEPIPRTLKAVGKLLDLYAKANGRFSTPVRLIGKNGLIHVMQHRYNIHVDVASVAWKPKALNACVFRYGNPQKVQRAEIYLSAALTVPWARFALANELAHLLLDDELSFTDNPVHTAHSLIDSPLFAKNGAGEPEYMYHVAAMELLIPWRQRSQLAAYRWGFFNATEKRAHHFGVPEQLMRQRIRRATKRLLKRGYADI